MFKSIATLRNLSTPGKDSRPLEKISILFHPRILCNNETKKTLQEKNDQDRENIGTIFIAVESSNNSCRIVSYSVKDPSHKSRLSQEDFTFIQCRRVSFRKRIQALTLLTTPSLIPILVVITKDGIMHKSGNLESVSKELPLFECRKEGVLERPSGGWQLFVGMDLVGSSYTYSPCFNSGGQDTSYTVNSGSKKALIIVVGKFALSPPKIVTLSTDSNSIIEVSEVKGLENVNSSISAVKIFDETSVEIDTWKALQHLWRNGRCQHLEQNWEGSQMAVAMIGLNDGSIYCAFVTSSTRGSLENIEVSHAVQIFEMKNCVQSIVSFCLVSDTNPTFTANSSRLVGMGSLGHVVTLQTCSSHKCPCFKVIVPTLSNTREVRSQSTIGLVTHAEPFPVKIDRNEEKKVPMENFSFSIIVTTNNGYTYLICCQIISRRKGSTNVEWDARGHYFGLPLRKDIATITSCLLPYPSHSDYNGVPDIFLAGLTYRRNLSLFLNPRKICFPKATSNNLSYVELDAEYTEVSDEKINHEQTFGHKVDSIIGNMLEKLAGIEKSKKNNDCAIEGNDDSIPIELTRSAAECISPIWPDQIGSSIDTKHKARDINGIEISRHFPTSRTVSTPALQQCQTNHVYQSVAASRFSSPPSLHDLKIIGSRRQRLANESRLVDVFHGGLAQSNSVTKRSNANESTVTLDAQLWSPHRYQSFMSTSLSFEEDNDREEHDGKRKWAASSSKAKRLKMIQLDCQVPELSSCTCLTFQTNRKNRYAQTPAYFYPQMDCPAFMPQAYGKSNALGARSALMAYWKETNLNMSPVHKEAVVIKAHVHRSLSPKNQLISDTLHTQMLTVGIPKVVIQQILPKDAVNFGICAGMNGISVLSKMKENGIQLRDKNSRPAEEGIALLELIGCAYDKNSANACAIIAGAALKQGLLKLLENENDGGFDAMKCFMNSIEMGPYTKSKEIIKFLKRSNEGENSDVEVESLLQLHRNLRALFTRK